MIEIPLSNSTRVAIIDDEDYDVVSGYNWNLGSDNHHPQAWNGNETIEMHTLILIPKEGFLIDHKDRNGLNCQRNNLRYANRSQQQANVDIYKNNHSGFKGVSWHARIGKYMVKIQINKQQKHIGYFKDKNQAAKAYNEAALKYHDEFAVLNSIAE